MRKLLAKMRKDSHHFKNTLMEAVSHSCLFCLYFLRTIFFCILQLLTAHTHSLALQLPMLVDENEILKKQWRNQIIAYIVLDILMLVAFAMELQFIVSDGTTCLVPIVPLLLFMTNIFVHLFSFLFAIAILNQSFGDVESCAWRCSGFKLAPHLRTPAQVSALKDPEVCIILTGLSANKISFKIGPVQIDWALISTVSGIAASAFGLAIPSFGSLGSNRACQFVE